MTAPTATTTTPVLDRLADRPVADQRQPFVAPWRRRQMDEAAERERQGYSRFEAVADITGAVAL